MFFKTKERADKQSSSKENFRLPRYSCVAHVCINGFDGEAILRNINNSGFCMESRTYAAIAVEEHYTLRIIPEAVSNTKPFDLEVEVRWVRSTEISCSAGFLIRKYPADRSFEKYLNFIKNRN
jgi:hypothetical protein